MDCNFKPANLTTDRLHGGNIIVCVYPIDHMLNFN